MYCTIKTTNTKATASSIMLMYLTQFSVTPILYNRPIDHSLIALVEREICSMFSSFISYCKFFVCYKDTILDINLKNKCFLFVFNLLCTALITHSIFLCKFVMKNI